ncbi:hypothetical protein CP02DC14_1367, partial [Chlamydia psittaci 02DC14]
MRVATMIFVLHLVSKLALGSFVACLKISKYESFLIIICNIPTPCKINIIGNIKN